MPPTKPSLVSLTFDDGLRSQFERAVPVLRKHRLVATFFLIANTEETHEAWDEKTRGCKWSKLDWSERDVKMLRGLLGEGHEIGSHGSTHREQMIKTQPDGEAAGSRKFIEERLGSGISSFCYPYYWSQQYLEAAVKRAGYRQGRAGDHSGYYPIGAPFDRFNIDCRTIGVNEDVAEWLRPGNWHVLTFHGIGREEDGWRPITVEEFDSLMTKLAGYRDAGRAEVVTFKDGAARCEHPA